jgi:transcriptional regulator with XRE-family HTH domain
LYLVKTACYAALPLDFYGDLLMADEPAQPLIPLGQTLKARRQERKLTQEQLAQRAGVPYTTLTKLESGAIKNPSMQVVSRLARALDLSLDSLMVPRVFAGENCVREIWRDVLATLTRPGDCMCISGIAEGMYLEAHHDELPQFLDAIKTRGLRQKLLICEGDRTRLKGEHLEYRWIPKEHFNPTPIYVYGGKVAILIWGPPRQAVILENEFLADAYRKQFLFIWQHAKPLKTG